MFKKDQNKITIINRHKYVVIFEEGIWRGMCQAIIKYACANNKYMKNCNKKNSFIIFNVFGCKQFVWIGND